MKRLLLSSVLVLGFAAPSWAEGCGEVTITQMDWASANVVTAVSKFLMEQGYGCTVTTVPSSTPTALTAVAETGTPDILTELWVNTAPTYTELVSAGKIVEVADVLSDGGIEGWWVPQYVVDEHPEAATLEGILANPALVGGRFEGCPDGWACRTVDDNMNKVIDFESKGIEVFNHGSGETLATAIAAAYADKKPWFGFYWAPTAILGKYPMVLVDMGADDAAIHACNSDKACTTPGISAYPRAAVKTAVTTTFKEREPDIAELMSNVSFTNDQMNGILAWMEDNNASAEEGAVYFLTNNKEVWSAWLNDSARGKLAAIIK
ncbi:glycine/betaine ABC transporter substrate-binding protein [Rhodobacter sp. HX-7-19]|uniref:Glycine/betaine ABC transporter substrate-binding protein n=1 Tax=Paragemmobacter kunshanensis TaxID=2583234 RepID=A0A6M1UB17_9RHOB|nr:glycine betaine ABC transporter substrate-binding protein [Rhodobacter kunshanensis]NGQ93353.1 glycine/betaine ABC transporter substrate-binding protein [Rhodobacter kunshanensis]